MTGNILLQADLVLDLLEFLLDYPELGWIPTLIYLFVELRTDRGIVKGRLMKMIRANTVVVRAIARTNEKIDTEEAEKLLAQDKNEPSDFIDVEHGSEMAAREEEERQAAEGSKESRND